MKLMIHELKAAIGFVRADRLDACFKILARVKLIQKQLFEQWAVLETLTPSEYEAFRPALGNSSGFQSAQYRAHRVPARQQARGAARRVPPRRRRPTPSSTRCCTRRRSTTSSCAISRAAGCRCRAACVERDLTQPYERNPDARAACSRRSTTIRERWWDAYDMCEKLVDVEERFQLWRFRHMKTVERIIGHKTGTGGSSASRFLQARARPVVLPRAHRRAHGDRRAMSAPLATPANAPSPSRRPSRRSDPGPLTEDARRAPRRAALLARARGAARPRSTSPTIRSAGRSTRRTTTCARHSARGTRAWATRGTPGTREMQRVSRAARRGCWTRRAPIASCPKTSAGQGLRAILNTLRSRAARRRDARRVRFARRDPARVRAARPHRARVRRAARRRRVRRR